MKNQKTKELQLLADFNVKGIAEESDDIIIEGFANTTDKDRGGDVVLESAWTNGGLDNYLKNPIILAYHDHRHPIGSMLDYSINNKGLHITARITKAAGDVYDLVKSGVLKAFSIGFRINDADYNSDADIFIIKDAELYEVSVVSVPMNQNSIFSVKKSFNNDKDYNEFKNSFIKSESINDDSGNNKGDTQVPNTNTDGKITLTAEELSAQTEKAIADAFAKAAAKAAADEEAKKVAIEAGKTGAESLVAEVEKRLAETNASTNATMLKAIEDMKAEIKEKSEEITAMKNSKMSFEDSGSRKLTDLEIDTAYLVAKIVNKKIEETNYFSGLRQKVGDHLVNATPYEMIYSTRMYDAIQDKLVIEPLFAANKIQMTSRSMTFPFNPQAGYASWISDTKYKSLVDTSSETSYATGADISGNVSSTGPARTHTISTISLKAEKLASKEAIGYEEEEDSIIPILPIVREAIAKRMARTTDVELLRGNIGAATHADIGVGLIDGVATLADDLNTEFTQAGAFGTTNPITIADLQATRRKMGPWGLNPSDVTYVVCESAYWDLLEDPDFRTMDLVGANATILRGQVGAINGSPVVVSDSFPTPGAGTYAAIAINTGNFLFGELRGLNTERTQDVLNQTNWIVTTRRFAFNEIDATAPAVSVLKYGS